MLALAHTAEAIAATSKKLEKTTLVAEYLQSVSLDNAVVSAVFLSGSPFPAWEESTLQVGGSLLWRLVAELSGRPESALTVAYREHGDLGSVAAAVLPARASDDLEPVEIQRRFRQIASARGAAAKSALLRDLLSALSGLEVKYVVKIMTGDLRIGLKESLVEDAIARAFSTTSEAVRRANMLLGDIGETLRLSASGSLANARMRLFHPLGFMLASPAASSEEAFHYFHDAVIEDKYDGIRAQAHVAGKQTNKEVRLFSRTRNDVTASFPELPPVLAALPEDVILDGEIVAWSPTAAEAGEPGQALPFTALQQRLGRKRPTAEMLRRVPVAYLVFDLLYDSGQLLLDLPLPERSVRLDKLFAGPRILKPREPSTSQSAFVFDPSESSPAAELLRAPVFRASRPQDLDRLFEAAQTRGNEGLMIKDPDSPYTPGRRGKSWLKLKRELATLDVVVTAVEYGHGKRIGVVSDYTFAVRDDDRLVDIGKAYSGLTDAEIAEMTRWFLDHTVENRGFRLIVEPRIVLEVAFNNIMKSDRHSSGFALRFPRIVRLRPDKLPADADTIERVSEIYARQRPDNTAI